ncbi:ATP-dependent DNA helicase [Vibrio breoganii]|uniref:DNA 5'-3' helicase n=1 Tax=Vibrio breoganii TaxID=553239 RepID=A0ABX1UAV0_9VIBR|nr:ATP-dependent DNA helicase [Vibrio breoganii]NMO75149.1 ATP-dependent DNA helicase [Vibrio breoganii]NMR71637.1 ATP-dependent DNA helicase [Vibrio breoganii]PMG02879.1 ATP-dependent helicase [Vibrio breoganii]PMG96732.1 ATP-dependent helicase [Vibrio breoganii]PML90377.1 ATP-dependent helicase [Vibrio breoganii]
MNISTVFSADGALGKAISGFQPRDEQTMMAENVHQAIKEQSQLVVEAGTGTGKTFAYLAPALLSGKKTIVSTGSKNLQEQLFHRDLPLMKDALGFTGRIALLKGRANYLCLDRLSRQIVESHGHHSDPQLLTQLVKVRSWSSSTKSGDLGECEDLAEDSRIIPDITSNNENCLGKECPSFGDCFVFKARNKALEADLVVVNHHLFLADMAVKETGFGELLPEAEVFIFDEAHQIPDIASQYFGQSISSKQIADLAKDIEIGYRTEAKDMRQLQKVTDKLVSSASEMRISLGEPGFRGNWRDALKNQKLQREMERLQDALQLCRDVLKMALGRSQLLDTAFDRVTQIQNRLTRVCDTSIMGYSYWFECTPRHFSLNITPLSVANKFQEQVDAHGGSWVFTSATLSVSGDFQHFTSRLGLKAKKSLALSSPFDYQSQARLCVPRYLPEPNSPQMAQKLVSMLTPVIETNKGRCFFLCTSHAMMKDLTERFRQRLDLPVLMQGESSKQALLKEFTELGDALLVATGAFWEGIDVRGDALSCVIIDKLPFTAPDDPLLKARIEDCKLNGGEPFYEVQLPDAVIALKQGVGRLIRDKSDRGALIICDNRLVTRDYGKMFLSSLPPIPRTRSVSNIINFLQPSTDVVIEAE